MAKNIQNVDAIAHKLRLASIKATNYKLEIAREKQHKSEKIVEKRKKNL